MLSSQGRQQHVQNTRDAHGEGEGEGLIGQVGGSGTASPKSEVGAVGNHEALGGVWICRPRFLLVFRSGLHCPCFLSRGHSPEVSLAVPSILALGHPTACSPLASHHPLQPACPLPFSCLQCRVLLGSFFISPLFSWKGSFVPQTCDLPHSQTLPSPTASSPPVPSRVPQPGSSLTCPFSQLAYSMSSMFLQFVRLYFI